MGTTTLQTDAAEASAGSEDAIQPVLEHPSDALDADVERRRYPRHAVPTRATLRVGPWYRQQRRLGVVANLSATGLALWCPAVRMRLGDTVRLRLPIPPLPGFVDHCVPCALTGTVVWVRPQADPHDVICGIRLSALVQERLEVVGWAWPRVMLIGIAVLLAALIVVLKSYNVLWFWYDPWFQLYSLVVAVYILSRTVLALLYRPPRDRGFFPTVSVVVAVKNEEAHIAQTIQRCFDSRYPADRLEVLVVDDGSTDQTWLRVTELLERYPSLRTFRFPDNRGKRHAMALGAEQAHGDILIYVDSDSYVDPEGIYRIVQGFADPTVGAVAGHVQVIVEPTSVISKMELVRYFISHRVMKAAESLFGAVTCCSGAFSAYRRSAVMAVLQPWLHQTFLGTQATFGDDRSLTNFVLRRHRVLFNETARCRTYVPDHWMKYFRQQLRWKKSWSRETLVASRLMYHKHPIAAISYYVGVGLTLFAPLMVIRNMFVLPLFYSMSCLPYLAGLGLVYLFFCCIFFYFTRSRYWYYGLTFAALYVGVLCWQNYYAMATVSKTHWGTR